MLRTPASGGSRMAGAWLTVAVGRMQGMFPATERKLTAAHVSHKPFICPHKITLNSLLNLTVLTFVHIYR